MLRFRVVPKRSNNDPEPTMQRLLRVWSKLSAGGKKGGKARWKGVTAEQRRAHARKAARARWASKRSQA